jgi:isopropylmalate/homocitrate/citramalate synthase
LQTQRAVLFSAKEIAVTDRLFIFDTTLRDGEQSPGASMTKDEKLRIARQLERLKVDVIEAGFAASSNGDFEAVKAIAQAIKGSTVCSLARANDRDISRAADALKGGESTRIHIFLATSDLHMEKKLRMTREQVFEQARLSVRFARNLSGDIEFSPEDGYRSDPEFLYRVLEAVIAEGATTINIPDTVGYAVPELYGEFLLDLRTKIPNSDKAVWSVHCHNDLGMAVANSLAGVKIGGARQVECTINGLGERAGNCSLEEIVMAVKTRRDYFGLDVGVDATQIVPASRLVAQTTGFVVQPNKAVVGANAFAHASGHPPGRRPEGARHLRDHACRGRRLGGQQDRPRQALGQERLQAAAEGARHRAGGRGRRQRRVPPLQGARRPQERHLRRGHPRPGDGRRGRRRARALPASSRLRSTRRRAPGRRRASLSPPARSSTGDQRRRRPGRRQPEGDRVERSRAARKWCSIRSTPSPRAAQSPRAR